ncbi:hypothetical protein L7E35_004629 [Vibrio parahaemolyticus]|nr:hypothetical protein [Vibrio parahaemolyticus]EIV1599683.1 hypothetical protein [Vibrio parahaemolyticus]
MILKVIKKNRKYFDANTQSGHSCKIVIDKNSENLEIGEHNLYVDDISILPNANRYGKKLLFKLKVSAEEQMNKEDIKLKTVYNKILIEECHKLCGVWNKEESVWFFNACVKSEVDRLDDIFNSEPIYIDIKAIEDIEVFNYFKTFMGRSLYKVSSIKTGAVFYDDVELISGNIIPTKEGSRIVKDSVIRLTVPKKLLSEYQDYIDDRFEVNVLD